MGTILAHQKVTGYVQLTGSTPETNAAQAILHNMHLFDKSALVEVGLFFLAISPALEVLVQSDDESHAIGDAIDGETRSIRFANPYAAISITILTKDNGIENIGNHPFNFTYNISAVHSPAD